MELLFSRNDFRELAGTPRLPSVSILMPTAKAGHDTVQNSIRFKNLVRRAEERLADERLLRPLEVEKLLEPAHRLIDDNAFWQHQDRGLAVYLAPDLFRSYRVPLVLEEAMVVDRQFYLKPLFELLWGDGTFYVLSLDQRHVQLFAGTRHDIAEVPLPETPSRLEDVVGYEVESGSLQWHSAVPSASRGERAGAQFHGGGAGEDDVKPELRKFLAAVDRGVHRALGGKEAPLVLAGIDYELAMYREINSYPHLVEGEVRRHPQDMRPEDLRELAWPLVEPLFTEARRQAEERYRALAGTGRTSVDPVEILPAAHESRIDVLFVARGANLGGAYDADRRAVALGPPEDRGGQDLLDLAAVQTALHGGCVYVVPPDQMPVAAPVAALFRY